MSDKINHPSHYTAGSIEVYDFIEAWNLDFTIGNVVKYVTRAPYKGTQLEDLKKAKWYLEKAIEKEEKRIAERVAASLDGKNVDVPSTIGWKTAEMMKILAKQKELVEQEKDRHYSNITLGYPKDVV